MEATPGRSWKACLMAVWLIAPAVHAGASWAAQESRGGRIIYASEFDGRLLVVDTETRVVETHPLRFAKVGDLAYNQTSHTLALVGTRTQDRQQSLYLLRWPGQDLQLISRGTSTHGSPYRPAFDPSGEYVYAVDYGPNIFRYARTKKKWEEIPVDGPTDFHAQGLAFSPSGHFAALSPGDFKGFVIADVRSDQFRALHTVLSDFEGCISPHWIDDNTIVFAGRQRPGLQFLWELNVTTGELRQLTGPPIGARDFLSVSPDGQMVAFTATGGKLRAEWAIWLLSPNTREPSRLTPENIRDSFLFPTWIEK